MSLYLRPVTGRAGWPVRITLQRAPAALHRSQRELSARAPLQRPRRARNVVPRSARPVIRGRLWRTGGRLLDAVAAGATLTSTISPAAIAQAIHSARRREIVIATDRG